MPYIAQVRRTVLLHQKNVPNSAGELNFLLTSVAINYLHTQGKSYSTINDILGALEGAKLEFYRRVAVPYEEGKIKENGDVY